MILDNQKFNKYSKYKYALCHLRILQEILHTDRIVKNRNDIDKEPYKNFYDNVRSIHEYLRTIYINNSTYNFTDLLEKLYEVVPNDILSQTIDEKSSNILNKQDFDMTIKDSNPVT